MCRAVQVLHGDLGGSVLIAHEGPIDSSSPSDAPPDPERVRAWSWTPSMLRLPEAETAGGYPWYSRLSL